MPHQLIDEPESRADKKPWLTAAAVVLGGAGLLCLCAAIGLVLARGWLGSAAVPQVPAVPTPPGATTAGDPAPVETPAATRAGVATVTLPPAATVPPPDPARNATAVRLPAPPTIDGDLREWVDVASSSSRFRVFNHPSWNGTEDLTAVWRLAWDEQNLYLGATIVDDVHVQTQTGNTTFRGDSLELQIDTDREGDYGPRLSPDDYQIALSPGNFADLLPEAFRFRGTSAGEIVDAPGHNIAVAARQMADGYTLEAAIPWADLGVQPREGMVLGLALNANDNDTPGTAVQEVMMSNAPGRRLTDPTTWGTLTLR